MCSTEMGGERGEGYEGWGSSWGEVEGEQNWGVWDTQYVVIVGRKLLSSRDPDAPLQTISKRGGKFSILRPILRLHFNWLGLR